jgi:hypothetical protein
MTDGFDELFSELPVPLQPENIIVEIREIINEVKVFFIRQSF